jgi:hypothetical protein
MVRRRARVPRGCIVEAGADVEVGGGSFWVREDSEESLRARVLSDHAVARPEAIDWMQEAHGVDSEGAEWARALPADDFDRLIRRHHSA